LHEVGLGHVDVDLRERAGRDLGQQRAVGIAQGEHVLRQGGQCLESAGQLRVHQHRTAAGLLQQVGELVPGEVVVDRDVHQPGPRDRQERDDVGVGVGAVGGHPVALGQPEIEQHPGRSGDRVVQLAVGPHPVGEAQSHPVRGPAGAAAHHVVDGARPNGFHDCSPWSVLPGLPGTARPPDTARRCSHAGRPRYRRPMSTPPPDPFGQDPQPGFGAYGAGSGHGYPAAPLDDPLVPADLRGWAERVVGVARRSLVPLLTIQVGVGVVGMAISLAVSPLLPAPGPVPGGAAQPGAQPGAQPDGAASLVAMLGLMAAVVIGILAQSGSTYVAIRDAAGRPTTASEGMRFAARLSPILIPWGIAAGALTMVGFILVIPGLYFAVVFGSTLIGVLTVERMPILRCFELVNRRLWPTVGRMMVAVVVAGIYSVVS